MSATLKAGNSGSFRINDVPFSREHTVPVFDVASETIGFITTIHIGAQPLTPHHFSALIDDATGDPFESLEAVKQWCESHVYAGVNPDADSITYVKVFNITDAPVLPEDKLPAETIVDAWLEGKKVKILLISEVPRTSNFSKPTASDTLSLNPGESFVNGDKVAVIATV